MKVGTPIYRFDITLFEEEGIVDNLKEWCKEHCKKWAFQGEECPTTKKFHFQMRVSLKKKSRMIPKMKWAGKVSPTSNLIAAADFYDYVTKEDTRVLGPFTDKDEEIYIPKQIREIDKLYPWQLKVIEISKIWDKRCINYLYCPTGNIGKSILCGYLRAYRLGRVLPMVNDYKEMMEIVCDMPTSDFYVIDMPRAINKEKLNSLYSAIETVKDGYAFDRRYKFREKVFDCPNIFVFSNKAPDLDLLSKDRWKLWKVENRELKPWIMMFDDCSELDS